jgi:hypothetical protein
VTDGPPPEPRGLQVTLAIRFELVVSASFFSVDLEAQTVVDEEILVPEPGHHWLHYDRVPYPLKSKPHDGFEPGTAVIHHVTNPVRESPRRPPTQLSDQGRGQKSLVNRRLERGHGVFVIQARDGLPQRLHPPGFSSRGHGELRKPPVNVGAGVNALAQPDQPPAVDCGG